MTADATPSAPLADLSRRMQIGDDAAWAAFHEQYGPLMFRILLAGTRGDPHLAAEALQRAYLRIARHVRACENEGMWIGWLRVVCRSALSDARRRERRFWNFFRVSAADEISSVEELTDGADLFALLDRAMDALDPETRQLLAWKYFVGESMAAIASRLEITTKAVESRLTRARGELRRQCEMAAQTVQGNK